MAAALRHAARRLCERALQQRGAQARSTLAAEESPARRLMTTSSISRKAPSSTAGAGPHVHGELERQFKKKKEELYDLLIAVKRAEIYPQLSLEDIKIHRLVTQLATQVEPRPHDPNWRIFRRLRRLNDFNYSTFSLGFYAMCFQYMVFSDKEEDDATSENTEANIVSDEPKNDIV